MKFSLRKEAETQCPHDSWAKLLHQHAAPPGNTPSSGQHRRVPLFGKRVKEKLSQPGREGRRDAVAGLPGSCLGAYKDKSSVESLTSPEAKYCSGHTDTRPTLPQRQRVCREKTAVRHVIAALTSGTPAGARGVHPGLQEVAAGAKEGKNPAELGQKKTRGVCLTVRDEKGWLVRRY